jgi:hypothetical protein
MEDASARRRRITVRFRHEDQRLYEIDELNGAYEPLHFVILNPRGEAGWYAGIPKARERVAEPGHRVNNTITIYQYAQYRMAIRMPARPELIDPLHYFGRLFHEWACDTFVNQETQQLQYVRLNQAALRRAPHIVLCDAVNRGEPLFCNDHSVYLLYPLTPHIEIFLAKLYQHEQ